MSMTKKEKEEKKRIDKEWKDALKKKEETVDLRRSAEAMATKKKARTKAPTKQDWTRQPQKRGPKPQTLEVKVAKRVEAIEDSLKLLKQIASTMTKELREIKSML